MFRRYSWLLQHLGIHEKQNHIVVVSTVLSYAWLLQHLKIHEDKKHIQTCSTNNLEEFMVYPGLRIHEKHNNIKVCSMFWRYSWFLQHLRTSKKQNMWSQREPNETCTFNCLLQLDIDIHGSWSISESMTKHYTIVVLSMIQKYA